MSQEQAVSVVRGFLEALRKSDVGKALSFFSDDGSWETPNGTFRGPQELRQYLTWLAQTSGDPTITESGIGLRVVEGGEAVTIAFVEHALGGTVGGKKWEVLGMCAYELREGKIRNARTVYDRLTVANQVTKGWLAKSVVRGVVRRMERGLR